MIRTTIGKQLQFDSLSSNIILSITEICLQCLGSQAFLSDLRAPEDKSGLLHLVGENLVNGGKVVPNLLHHPLGRHVLVRLDGALNNTNDSINESGAFFERHVLKFVLGVLVMFHKREVCRGGHTVYEEEDDRETSASLDAVVFGFGEGITVPGGKALARELGADFVAAELPSLEEVGVDAVRDLTLERVTLGFPVGRGTLVPRDYLGL